MCTDAPMNLMELNWTAALRGSGPQRDLQLLRDDIQKAAVMMSIGCVNACPQVLEISTWTTK